MMGFIVDTLDQPRFLRTKHDDLEVDDEDESAECTFRLRLSLMRQRFWTAAKWMWGLPHSAVLLLHPDDTAVLSQLNWMKEIDAAWTALRPQTTTAAKQLKERSCMRWTLTADIMSELRAVNFEEVPPSLKTVLRRIFSNTGTTVLTEEFFQMARDGERDSTSGEVTAQSAFWVGSQSSTFSGRRGYDFREIDATTIPEGAPHKEALERFSRAIHYPRYRASSLHTPAKKGGPSLRTMPGYGTPKWTTMAAWPGLGKPVEELKFLVGLSGRFGMLGKFWKAQLLVPGLLLQDISDGAGETWYWSLGCHTCAVGLWPAKMEAFGKKEVTYRMRTRS
jgi:hypothetical protein